MVLAECEVMSFASDGLCKERDLGFLLDLHLRTYDEIANVAGDCALLKNFNGAIKFSRQELYLTLHIALTQKGRWVILYGWPQLLVCHLLLQKKYTLYLVLRLR